MKRKVPIVSVLVAAHNEERYIGRCLRSLMAQSFPAEDYEVIVVDDASDDRTDFVLETFGSDIAAIRNATRLGLPGSLNVGIKAARGQFIVRVDADDYVHANMISMLAMFLQENSYMDATACDYLVVDDHENVLSRQNCMEKPIACGIMFRMEYLVDIGMYDEDFLMHEDQDLRIRFQRKYAINRVELPLYRYRRHADNMTNDHELSERHLRALERKHGPGAR